LYGVSTVTIRNDLAFLEKQGIAVRAYGGALICEGQCRLPSLLWKIKLAEYGGEAQYRAGCC
jgi:DeoR/GlpR family transcriptional regulator of sugar metabolism